jgi:hypothetical protein
VPINIGKVRVVGHLDAPREGLCSGENRPHVVRVARPLFGVKPPNFKKANRLDRSVHLYTIGHTVTP